MPCPRGISVKVNVIARLEFKFTLRLQSSSLAFATEDTPAKKKSCYWQNPNTRCLHETPTGTTNLHQRGLLDPFNWP